MADEIINRVAKSNLVSIDLETFYTTEKRSLIDIKYWLFQELVLKEKEFRETLKNSIGNSTKTTILHSIVVLTQLSLHGPICSSKRILVVLQRQLLLDLWSS